MNRELFISDYHRLTRQYPPEALPEVLADYVKDIPKNPGHAISEPSICPERIIERFCGHYGLSMEILAKKTRVEAIRYKRQKLIYLLVRRSRLTLSAIGKKFAKDHSSVSASAKKIRDTMDVDPTVYKEMEDLNALL